MLRVSRRSLAAGTAVAALGAAGVPAAHAAYPGTNGPFAYRHADRGQVRDFRLFTTPLAGPVTPLTATGTAYEPVWSPDGRRVAFAGDLIGDSDTEIVVVNADGSHPTPITDDERWEASPTWSADGKRIAFSRDGDLWTANADGTEQKALTVGPETDLEPAWAPDGSNRIVFVRRWDYRRAGGPSAEGNLMIADAESGAVEPLTPWASDGDPNWSPDGEHVVFERSIDGMTHEIWTVESDGDNDRPLVASDAAADPVYSPDGTRIAYVEIVDEQEPEPTAAEAEAASSRLLTIDAAATEKPSVVVADAVEPDWGVAVEVTPPPDDGGGTPAPGASGGSTPPATTTAPTPVATVERSATPAPRTCTSRRRFTIHVPARYGRVVSATVIVNGKRVAVRRGSPRWSAVVNLVRLPKARYTVEIRFRTADGKTHREVRHYRTCIPRPAAP